MQSVPSSVELSYYKDASKREKRRTIDLSKFVGIRPNAKVGTKEHVFAIETEERKYILKASDQNTKNIWLAKLCELCGQGQLPQINSVKCVKVKHKVRVGKDLVFREKTEQTLQVCGQACKDNASVFAFLLLSYS